MQAGPSSHFASEAGGWRSTVEEAQGPWAVQIPTNLEADLERWISSASNTHHPPQSTVAAGAKRKISDDGDIPTSASTRSGSKAIGRTKRYRKMNLHQPAQELDAMSDYGSPPMFNDDGMDWEGQSDPSAPVVEPQLEELVEAPSPIVHFELLRDAKPPIITTQHSSFLQSGDSRDLPPSQIIPMHLEVTNESYKFLVPLPGYSSEQITMSCKRGSMLTVVADRWELETHCRHMWNIMFDNDVDMGRIVASMKGGLLEVAATRFRQSIPIEYEVKRGPRFP